MVRGIDDFVLCGRHGNSLRRMMERYPDGCPSGVAAAALGVSESEFAQIRDGALAKMRGALTRGED